MPDCSAAPLSPGLRANPLMWGPRRLRRQPRLVLGQRAAPPGRDPRKARAPLPHYYVQPRAITRQPVAVMTPALHDPMDGDLCECGRPAEHPVHLVPKRTPKLSA